MYDFLDKRPMTVEEDKYTFRQSSQISGQTGLIGYLRADFGKNGNEFYSSWEDWNKDLKTPDFKQELDEVINYLREEGDILSGRVAMNRYCNDTPQSKMTMEPDYYGVRIDTDKYAYLMRLNPNKGDYNLYCYCYEKVWLDRHIAEARKGIRFITPEYEPLFTLDDGDKIRITRSNGEYQDYTCRYIDQTHLEVGNDLYHICQFAEIMEKGHCAITPLRASLPESCYTFLLTEESHIGIIKKGEFGYYPSDLSTVYGQEGKDFVAELNRQDGVTPAQSAAMSAGSIFGWDCPAADPKNYDVNGVIARHRINKDISEQEQGQDEANLENVKDFNEKNENNEIAFLFDDTKIGERSQSFSDGYVIINASTKDEAVETFKAQYGRGKHNEALCAEVVSDFNRVGQIKRSNLPCHNYIDLTKPQEPNQSNTEEQTDGRK